TASTSTPTMDARWGQASALFGSLFVVQGGKSQGTSGGYTYSSAPNQGAMYALDLSSSFSTSSPPWQSVSVDSSSLAAPTVSFHTLSPINSTSLLLFGGDGGTSLPVQTNNDSAYIVNLGGSTSSRTVSYSRVSSTWSEPMRRIYHTSESNVDGAIWIMGGEKADGSNLLLDELWALDINATSPSFGLSPSSPPGSIAGSTSTLLSDGTLLLLGGIDASGQLQSFETVYAYSTKAHEWSQTSTQASNTTLTRRQDSSASSAFPAPRRNHVAVSLPQRRVFVQGGASADLSTAYSDAWILDWSVDPPMWTQINSTGGPGARYGHAAVAYGRGVVLAFGWSGGNAADSTVHVFDGTSLTSTSQGSWSGGSWSSTYSPDPEASQSSASDGSSASTGSNGSSTSSGGSETPSSGSNGSGTESSGFPKAEPTSTGDGVASNNNSKGGTSDGAKAGAALGAIIGAGLVVGAGYAVYRKKTSSENWRHGDGSAGLLGGPSRKRGRDDAYMMEKGYTESDYDRPYHNEAYADGRDLSGGVFGRKRGRAEGSHWSMGNIGHAMEGSGPHFRERLAILTGLGKRETNAAPRVDMLADEGDGNSLCLRTSHGLQKHADADDDELESPVWNDRHVREHSYARVGGDEDLSLGDLGSNRAYVDRDHDYVVSPFEDPSEEPVRQRLHPAAGAGAGLLATAGAAMTGRKTYGRLNDGSHVDEDDEDGFEYEDQRSDFDVLGGPSSGPSVQSHSTTGKSEVPSSALSYDVQSPGGLVSFSDSYGRATGPNQSRIKRSPTWWDRFMGNSLLERSASGRLLWAPGSDLPIRDPAPPPVVGLEAITESPRSRDVSGHDGADPFADRTWAGPDEMGRRVGSDADGTSPFSSYQHGRSLSSLGSAKTTTSSHFESRFGDMDVIQRVRTGSSRRAGSTRTGSTFSDSESEAALSRGPSMLRPKNMSALDERSMEEDETSNSMHGAESDATGTPSPDRLAVNRAEYRRSNVSDTPSITPITTKRARLNPLMTSPQFPSGSVRSPTRPISVGGSVKDRIKAFEEQQQQDSGVEASPSIWTASLSSSTSMSPSSAFKEDPIRHRAASPASSAGTSARPKKVKYTHGLAPKAQLFVANPDDKQRN
ncbi:hypothetical protein BCV70DRAFT_145051, partial [Testicularia cyperi]